jgi:PPOX class probable F420-dependent enzyme
VSSRRAQIAMTGDEIAAFLASQRVVTCATLGRDGWPHLMPLWYVVRDGELWSWTYAKSQKVRNLERDPRCTVQVETGEAYHELRGVMVKAECELHRDLEVVWPLGVEIIERLGGAALDEGARAALRAQAAKRVGLQFVACRVASWDHRKLAGTY